MQAFVATGGEPVSSASIALTPSGDEPAGLPGVLAASPERLLGAGWRLTGELGAHRSRVA